MVAEGVCVPPAPPLVHLETSKNKIDSRDVQESLVVYLASSPLTSGFLDDKSCLAYFLHSLSTFYPGKLSMCTHTVLPSMLHSEPLTSCPTGTTSLHQLV